MTEKSEVVAEFAEPTAHLLTETDPMAVPRRLAELGWLELWNDDRETAARALFGQQGRLVRTSPMLSLLMGAEVVKNSDPFVTVLLPHPTDSITGWTTFAGGGARVLAQADALSNADSAVLALDRDGRRQLVRVHVRDLHVESLGGLDPSLSLAAVDASEAIRGGDVLHSDSEAQSCWTRAYDLGRRLIVEEIVGAVSEQLAMTVEYAGTRTQFGRAIGSYQAVKHKLAEVKVAVETAQLSADDAWADGRSEATTLAKVHAGDAVKLANKHCLQVLGGIGFTWEHSFHTFYRRGILLDALLGSAEQLTDALGRAIVAEQRLPAVSVL